MVNNQVSRADIEALKKEIADSLRNALTWEHQPDGVLNQVSPTQNQWYVILDTTADVIVYRILGKIDTTDETLEIRITVDGQTYTSDALVATFGTDYGITWDYSTTTSALRFFTASANPENRPAFLVIGRNIKIEMRKTTATGSGNLRGLVIYGQRDAP